VNKNGINKEEQLKKAFKKVWRTMLLMKLIWMTWNKKKVISLKIVLIE